MSRIVKAAISAAIVSASILSSSVVFAVDAPATVHSAATSRYMLDRLLPEVKFSGASLSDVIDFLADSTDANISVDWKTLDHAHVAKDAPITLRMSSNVSLRKVLKMVLSQAGGTGALIYNLDDGVIEITTQEASDKQLISRTYPIQDLLFQALDHNDAPDLSLQNASQGQSGGGGGGGGGGGQSLFQGNTSSSQTQQANTQKATADDIIKLITDTVKPELWQINGGTATISYYRGNLIVNAPRSIHELLQNRD